jgi:hypothetical protein
MSQTNQPQPQPEQPQPQPQPQQDQQTQEQKDKQAQETKSTIEIMREYRKMKPEERKAMEEKMNKTDSAGNRCSYCGKSFDDQIQLTKHQSAEHKDANKPRKGEGFEHTREIPPGETAVALQDQQVQQAQQAQAQAQGQQPQIPP